MKFSTLLVGLLFAAANAGAAEWQDSDAVGRAFKAAGVNGTFVLYDVSADRYTVFDRSRAQQRFDPASTFKAPNTLIGLTVGSVANVDQVEKTGTYNVYAKTGWSDSSKPGIGWWTGWVQKGDRTYAFALNIDIVDDADGQKRVPLGKASLAALGVIPAPSH